MKPHPDASRIRACTHQCLELAGNWSGTVYRSASPEYARSTDLLTGEGSRRHGGRWNPPDSFRTVYSSTTPETAMAETLAHFRYYGMAVHQAMPRTFAAASVSFQRLLDLTSDEVRGILQITDAMLSADWRKDNRVGRESLSQAIGRAVSAEGIEAILASSAADPAGRNVVWFPDTVLPESIVQILRADLLDA